MKLVKSSPQSDLKSVSVVLPCHNEVLAIVRVLERLIASSESWSEAGVKLSEIVVVDDGSLDGSRKIAESWVQTMSDSLGLSIRVLGHGERRGYGAALKTGISASGGDFIAFYDVDGTYDPDEIPRMVAAMASAGAVMACGDRLSQCMHMPLTREFGNRIFVATINLLYRTRVYDSCTGMRVFAKELKDFFSGSALPDSLDYSLAMTLTFLRTGHRLIEVPISYSKRVGRSKLQVLTDGPRFFLRILGSWLVTSDDVKVFRHSRKID